VRALIRSAASVDCDAAILKAVEERNTKQKSVLFQKITKRFGEDLSGRTFALWGLSFKPNTDDMREAPSRYLMEALWRAGATVQAYDPEAMTSTRVIYGGRSDLILCDSKEAALHGADALLVATEWKVFRVPPFEKILANLKEPVIFDGRNLYDPHMMMEHGIEYHSIGRKPVPAELQVARQPERRQAAE
jgi:UDPglucose 6-dehydrogenase